MAATCNVRLSAGKSGVLDKIVYKHLLRDPASRRRSSERFGSVM